MHCNIISNKKKVIITTDWEQSQCPTRGQWLNQINNSHDDILCTDYGKLK